MISCIIFTDEDELTNLTGLDHDSLWEAGFDLDDWDIGFCCEKPLDKNKEWWLLQKMDAYCCGYKEVRYKDLCFYLVYHA